MPAEFEAIFSKARHGRYKEVNALLEAGANVDGTDARGNTPLHAACQGGSLKTVKALLRRKEAQRQAELESTIDVGELSIHPGRHEVTLAGEPLELTYTEFALLQFLAKRPGWAYTRTQIVDAVKGEDYPVTERSVDVQVAGLRKKLGTFGSSIETVRGVGYRFRA